VRLRGLVRAQFAGFILNRVVPTTVAGDGVRVEWIRRLGVPGATAVATVVLDRLLGGLALAAVGIVPSIVYLRMSGDPVAAVAAAVLAGVGVVTGIVLASERI